MKATTINTLPFGAVVLAAILLLSGATSAYAIGPRAALREAYAALAVARHDYEGHRGHAMRYVRAAGRDVGLNLTGDGKGNETMAQSQDHLRYAKSMLQQARTGLGASREHRAAIRSIDSAIDEINKALRVGRK